MLLAQHGLEAISEERESVFGWVAVIARSSKAARGYEFEDAGCGSWGWIYCEDKRHLVEGDSFRKLDFLLVKRHVCFN